MKRKSYRYRCAVERYQNKDRHRWYLLFMEYLGLLGNPRS